MTIDRIGRYDIKSEIAKGGMATVIHAYDPRFERDVAIKILPQAFLHDPQFRVRFDREAKMIALLEHPAIVPVYDFGEEEGQPYIVMRYMSGGSLTERIEQGKLSITETSQMISRLAPGLDAAHARNIIHRDLKPGNILFDQYGNAYLSDFGIARLSESSSATLTGTAILGTPAYMSPEQVQGDKEIDGRSDIYALGVMIYQMIAGETPYSSDTPGKVMMMHVLQPVPDIYDVIPDLPPGCNELIQKAMAKDPDARFANASELASALENVAKGMPVQAASSSTSAAIAAGQAISDSEKQTVLSPGKTVVSSGGAAGAVPRGAVGTAAEGALPERSRLMTLGLPILAVLVVGIIVVGALAFFGRSGTGPLAFIAPPSPTATSTLTSTPRPPTETPEGFTGGSASRINEELTPEEPTEESTETPVPPTPTETPTLTPALPVIGGADKIAFLSFNNLFTANLDGSDLVQYTEDNSPKFNLQWTPDGQHVNFISGRCVHTVDIETKVIDILACFNFTELLKLFEISPNGDLVAMSIDNQLYILPYDVEALNQIQRRDDLTELAPCEHFAPYMGALVKYGRWSRDQTQFASIIMGVSREIGSADTVQIIPVDECVAAPRPIDNFPPPRYYPEEYRTSPIIQNFGWDGLSLFAHATFIRTGGFGNLHIYNSDLHKASIEVNPLDDGSCCYRDPQFSPDGTQLLFAYQMHPGGENAIQFYMIPYGTIGTGLTYEPLPIIMDFDAREWPQPALRPAQ